MDEEQVERADTSSPAGFSRRAFGGLLTAGAGAIVGGALVNALDSPGTGAAAAIRWTSDPHGATQAGVARPETPHPHALISSYSLSLTLDRAAAIRGLASDLGMLGHAIAELKNAKPGKDPLIPDGVEDLAVTVGIGPRIARMVSPTGAGTDELPEFAHDESIRLENRGGDLLLCVYCSSPAMLTAISDFLIAKVRGSELLWRQAGTRGAGTGSVARNPLGFHDGVIVPRGQAELDENVWIQDGRYNDGTILVIRRLRLDIQRWNTQSTGVQEATIGRRKISGSPLSGGKPTDAVNLQTKTAEGDYLTPARSHARAAHPSFTASQLMLRRGYIFDNGSHEGKPDSGLLFMAYQKDLKTFSKTQLRLDANDDLMRYVRPTASATFLVLPGYTESSPLGRCLLET